MRGNLTASDRVDIRSDGSLTGDVIAARISIEDGAFFKGGIDIRKGGQPQQQKPNGEEKPLSVGSRRPLARGHSFCGKFGRNFTAGTFLGARFALYSTQFACAVPQFCRTG